MCLSLPAVGDSKGVVFSPQLVPGCSESELHVSRGLSRFPDTKHPEEHPFPLVFLLRRWEPILFNYFLLDPLDI